MKSIDFSLKKVLKEAVFGIKFINAYKIDLYLIKKKVISIARILYISIFYKRRYTLLKEFYLYFSFFVKNIFVTYIFFIKLSMHINLFLNRKHFIFFNLLYTKK